MTSAPCMELSSIMRAGKEPVVQFNHNDRELSKPGEVAAEQLGLAALDVDLAQERAHAGAFAVGHDARGRIQRHALTAASWPDQIRPLSPARVMQKSVPVMRANRPFQQVVGQAAAIQLWPHERATELGRNELAVRGVRAHRCQELRRACPDALAVILTLVSHAIDRAQARRR